MFEFGVAIPLNEVTYAFGSCVQCDEPREAVIEDDDLVLICSNGHRSELPIENT